MLPLLLIYEIGVMSLGGANPEVVRNGADHWFRFALRFVGLKFFWVPPVLMLLVFVGWCWVRWEDRPSDLVGVLSGMILESVCFALGLWLLSRILGPLLLQAGIELSILSVESFSDTEPVLKQVVTYLGAGIYEEALFRLALFSALLAVLRFVELEKTFSVGIAAIASAIIFSVAHHIGPYGQAYSNYLFLFRVMAGLYFAVLYQTRGFGIAVGTHACYNVMVSLG
jgi:membrane protease YdiL (CAAX protease family)